MKTNNHQIVDYSAVIEKEYGKHGTPERTGLDEEAYAFYISQLLLDARKSHIFRAQRPSCVSGQGVYLTCCLFVLPVYYIRFEYL